MDRYVCHNTTLTQTNYNLCGDYAGFAQAYIQERHPGAQAILPPEGLLDILRGLKGLPIPERSRSSVRDVRLL